MGILSGNTPHNKLFGDEDEPVFFEPVQIEEGGPGSGNFGHAGRPGEVGGSGGGGGAAKEEPVTSVLHGTSYERLQSILKQGLVPQKGHNWDQAFYQSERKGVVFVTRAFMAASRYAETSQTDASGSVPVVLELSIPKSLKLHRDTAGESSDRYTSEHIKPEWIKTVYIQTSTEPRVFTWKKVPASSLREEEEGYVTVYAPIVLHRGTKKEETMNLSGRKLVAVSGNRYLEETSPGQGRVIIPSENYEGPIHSIASIAARGYWEPIEGEKKGG